MATTTPNYGWTVPTSTDLVKDGATAIETLGDSVDATVKALNPETTLGDISYRSSTANTNTRLGIGTTGQVLSVSGGVPAWTTLSSSAGLTKIVGRSSFSNVTNTGTTFDSCFSTTYSNYVIIIDQAAAVNANDTFRWQWRSGGSTIAAGYYSGYTNITWNGTSAPVGSTNAASLMLGTLAAGANTGSLTINFYDPNANNNNNKLAYTGYTPQLQGGIFGAGHCDNANNVDGFILSCSTGNIYTANVTVYGLAI